MPVALAWDRETPWFQWINALLVGILLLSGYFLIYRHAFHGDGREAQMALKGVHVWVGAPFAVTLAGRRRTWGSRVLLARAMRHVTGVVVTEALRRSGLMSGMISVGLPGVTGDPGTST